MKQPVNRTIAMRLDEPLTWRPYRDRCLTAAGIYKRYSIELPHTTGNDSAVPLLVVKHNDARGEILSTRGTMPDLCGYAQSMENLDRGNFVREEVAP